jgi:hypothetical protein
VKHITHLLPTLDVLHLQGSTNQTFKVMHGKQKTFLSLKSTKLTWALTLKLNSVLLISKSGSNKTPKDIFYLKFQLLKMERKTFNNSPPRSQKYRLAKCL